MFRCSLRVNSHAYSVNSSRLQPSHTILRNDQCPNSKLTDSLYSSLTSPSLSLSLSSMSSLSSRSPSLPFRQPAPVQPDVSSSLLSTRIGRTRNFANEIQKWVENIEGTVSHVKRKVIEDPEEALMRYHSSFSAGATSPDAFLKSVRRILKEHPRHIPSILHCANLLLRRGPEARAEALKMVERALDLNPRNAVANFYLLQLVVGGHDIEQATQQGEKTVHLLAKRKLKPTAVRAKQRRDALVAAARTHLIQLYVRGKRIKAATAVSMDMIQEQPSNPMSYILRALVCSKNYEFDKAIELYQKVIDWGKSTAEVIACQKQGYDLEDAVKEAKFHLGMLYVEERKQPELALPIIFDALSSAPYKEFRDLNFVRLAVRLMQGLQKELHVRMALEGLREVIGNIMRVKQTEEGQISMQEMREFGVDWMHIGVAWMMVKVQVGSGLRPEDQVEMEKHINEALSINPDNKVAQMLKKYSDDHVQIIPQKPYVPGPTVDTSESEKLQVLGYELVKENKTDEAIKIFTEALILNPSNREAVLQLGLCHLKQGKHPKALKFFKKAVDLAPQWALANRHYGKLLILFGRVDEGMKKLQSALRTCERLRDVSIMDLLHFDIAATYISQRNMDDAIPHLETIIKALPAHTDALWMLGYCHLSNENPKKGFGYMRKGVMLNNKQSNYRLLLGMEQINNGEFIVEGVQWIEGALRGKSIQQQLEMMEGGKSMEQKFDTDIAAVQLSYIYETLCYGLRVCGRLPDTVKYMRTLSQFNTSPKSKFLVAWTLLACLTSLNEAESIIRSAMKESVNVKDRMTFLSECSGLLKEIRLFSHHLENVRKYQGAKMAELYRQKCVEASRLQWVGNLTKTDKTLIKKQVEQKEAKDHMNAKAATYAMNVLNEGGLLSDTADEYTSSFSTIDGLFRQALQEEK